MLSPAHLARPTACLRCQLREVVLCTRLLPQPQHNPHSSPCRAFSTRHPPCQELVQYSVRTPKTYFWKHPLTKRVVGGKGKRQRVVAERLATDSLNQPSNVIVFQDITEEPDTPVQPPQADSRSQLSTEDVKGIKDTVFGRELAPGEAEVNASIDALRPEATIVDTKGFQMHRSILNKGYNFQQLNRYLVASLGHSAKPGSALAVGDVAADALSTSQWRPGQTPLENRHAAILKKNGSNTKVKTIDKILRLVWQLKIQSEGQVLGELEMKLQPWQSAMLFDLTHNGEPYYQRYITTRLLLESSNLQIWRPDNVLRITARQTNAEEIARQLRRSLLAIEPLRLDLDAFMPPLPETERESTAFGSPMRDEEIRYVSNLTKCIIVPERESILVIYGSGYSRRHSARRLLLSFLEVSAHVSYAGLSNVGDEARSQSSEFDSKLVAMPVIQSSVGLHRRYHGLELVRSSRPRNRKAGLTQPFNGHPQVERLPSQEFNAAAVEKLARALAGELEEISEPSHGESTLAVRGSYWRPETRLSEWKAQFCKILHLGTEPSQHHTETSGIGDAPTVASTVIQSDVPGTERLLRYFTTSLLPRPLNPKENTQMISSLTGSSSKHSFDRRMPYLISHFVPSPAAIKMYVTLPHIEMRFRISSAEGPGGPRELKLIGMRAILDEQYLDVPLPDCSVDVRFTRDTSAISSVDLAMRDNNIHEFWSALRRSVQSEEATLIAPPALNFLLPPWMLGPQHIHDSSPATEVEAGYLFERFQQVQKIDFTPDEEYNTTKRLNTEARDILETFPGDLHLSYAEIEGGAVHGSQTVLSLQRRLRPSRITSSTASSSGGETIQVEVDMVDSAPETDSPALDTSKSKESSSEDLRANTNVEQGGFDPAHLSTDRTVQMTTTVLRVAQLLTHANGGSLEHMGDAARSQRQGDRPLV